MGRITLKTIPIHTIWNYFFLIVGTLLLYFDSMCQSKIFFSQPLTLSASL